MSQNTAHLKTVNTSRGHIHEYENTKRKLQLNCILTHLKPSPYCHGMCSRSSVKDENLVSILSFRRVPYVVCFLLGISPASEV